MALGVGNCFPVQPDVQSRQVSGPPLISSLPVQPDVQSTQVSGPSLISSLPVQSDVISGRSPGPPPPYSPSFPVSSDVVSGRSPGPNTSFLVPSNVNSGVAYDAGLPKSGNLENSSLICSRQQGLGPGHDMVPSASESMAGNFENLS